MEVTGFVWEKKALSRKRNLAALFQNLSLISFIKDILNNSRKLLFFHLFLYTAAEIVGNNYFFSKSLLLVLWTNLFLKNILIFY